MIGDGDRNKVSNYDDDDDGNEHCGILGKIDKKVLCFLSSCGIIFGCVTFLSHEYNTLIMG